MNVDASQSVPVTVPDNPDPSSPIDLGEIVLVARPQRANGTLFKPLKRNVVLALSSQIAETILVEPLRTAV
jgi:hypothetical protein